MLNACGPGMGLSSSPSVVFTDDQALLADRGTLYSSTSEEAASSIASVNHDEILEHSQPESQVSKAGVTFSGQKAYRKFILTGYSVQAIVIVPNLI